MVAGLPSLGLFENRVPLSSTIISIVRSVGIRAQLTETRPVVDIRIGKVKVTVKLPVVKLHGHRVMGLLVHSPHSAGQV